MVSDNKGIVSTALLDSLCLKYQSDIQAARATLMVYLTSAVGIGEHPQHLEEMDKLVEAMANAEDKLDCLKKYFNGGDNDALGFSMSQVAGTSSEHHYTNCVNNAGV